MTKQGIASTLSMSALLPALLLLAAAIAASDVSAGDAKPKAGLPSASKSAEPKRTEAKPAAEKTKEAKDALGDAFISQNALRVYLGRPATVTLYNARGQLLFHLESSRSLEVLPLSGVNTGFLYLTLRAGPLELTKKLVYSGK